MSRIYCIGPEGGYGGSDGLREIDLVILVSDGGRQAWQAVHYCSPIRPLGKIRAIIPMTCDHSDALLDSCIAFFPEFFKDCPSLAKVREALIGVERMDFNLDKNIPAGWETLREEAREHFKDLPVYGAELIKVE